MIKLDMPPCALGEGPLWHKETKEFVFTDILAGTLYACDEAGKVRTLLETPYLTGAFLFDRQGDILVCTEKGIFRCPYGGGVADFQPVAQVPLASDERFNDAICDPIGRILAGTKTDRNVDGSLWLLEAGKEPRKLLGGLHITNGMGFSADGKVFYHTDSGNRTIYRYDYDVETGEISNGQTFVTLTDNNDSVPDGMTVDAAGNVWTALWGGSCIRQYSADGELLRQIDLPATQPSSVIFGGERQNKLMVTSAAVGAPELENGSIWLLAPGCQGREEYAASL